MSLQFQKNKEDFICEHCGMQVFGNGYTNHCPVCLWSKHVDVTPGDRSALCGGLMEPLSLSLKKGDYILLHRCVRCGYEKPNRTAPRDDLDMLLKPKKD